MTVCWLHPSEGAAASLAGCGAFESRRLLTLNHLDLPVQKEAESQLSGPIREPHREACPASSYQLPVNMFLGRFLKPYFKDKLTGLVRQTDGRMEADRQTA